MPNFASVVPSIAQLAHREKLCTQLLTHSVTYSPSLFDAPGTETFASENQFDNEDSAICTELYACKVAQNVNAKFSAALIAMQSGLKITQHNISYHCNKCYYLVHTTLTII